MRRLLRVPWTARRSYQFSLKEISPESSLEGLTLKLKTPKLWPPDAKNWLIRKDPDAGKNWMQEKGMIEDEMVGWRHRLNGHEFEQALRVGDGREAWRAAVHGVAKGRTRLRWQQQWKQQCFYKDIFNHLQLFCISNQDFYYIINCDVNCYVIRNDASEIVYLSSSSSMKTIASPFYAV